MFANEIYGGLTLVQRDLCVCLGPSRESMAQQESRHAANRRRLAQPFLNPLLLQSSGWYGLVLLNGTLLRNHFFMPCRGQIYKQDLRKLDVKFRKLVRGLVCSMAPHPSRVERTRFGMCWTSWCQIMVPEMPGTTLEISRLHYQPFR